MRKLSAIMLCAALSPKIIKQLYKPDFSIKVLHSIFMVQKKTGQLIEECPQECLRQRMVAQESPHETVEGAVGIAPVPQVSKTQARQTSAQLFNCLQQERVSYHLV